MFIKFLKNEDPGYQLCRELLTRKWMAWWDLLDGGPEEMWIL